MNPLKYSKSRKFCSSHLVSNEIPILIVEFHLNLFNILIIKKKSTQQYWSIIIINNFGPFHIFSPAKICHPYMK
jgi:hypothetical protein